jgi:hypothetical protein
MKTKDSEINRSTTMTMNPTKRRINSSSCSSSYLYERRDKHQSKRRRKKSKGEIIHSRESYIRRGNEDGNHPITDTSDHSWYYHKEDHDNGMSSNNYVKELMITS